MSDWHNDLMCSSERDDWRTPKDLFDKLNEEFHFTVDLCADDHNHLCDKYYTKENDGFKADLTGERVYCNPPYGRTSTGAWIKKCAEGGGRLRYAITRKNRYKSVSHVYI